LTFTRYFDSEHADDLVEQLQPFSDGPREKIPYGDYPRNGEANIYFNLNPANKDLIARSYNKIIRSKLATSDSDIVCYNLFPVDVDPIRPAGISSTGAEKAKALEVILKIKEWLREHGIESIPGDSGNGHHLLIPTIIYKNSSETTAKINQLLQLLDKKFSTEFAKVDTTVGNAARIWKLYGTLAMKGCHIPERPHRFSFIDLSTIPADVDIFQLLENEIKEYAAEKDVNNDPCNKIANSSCNNSWDQATSQRIIESLLDKGGFVHKKLSKSGLVIYPFKTCPCHTDHDGDEYECSVSVSSDGKFGGNCFHNESASWKDFKDAIGWNENIQQVLTDLDIKHLKKDIKKSVKTPVHADVADKYLADHCNKNPIRHWRLEWLKYDQNRYVKLYNEEINASIMRYLATKTETRSHATINFCRSVLENIQSSVMVPHDVEAPVWLSASNNSDYNIPLQNGILQFNTFLENMKLLNHSPDFFSTIVLPYSYNQEAKCEKWLSFLKRVLPDSETQNLLQEWCGYCFTPQNNLQKFMMFCGEGSNGKSVVCSTLTQLLGEENVSSIPLELFQEKYSLVHTLGKLANIVSEVGEIDKTAEGFLKAFVAADSMTFEQKYKDVITAKPTARLVFSTNNLPRFVDKSDGIWRRLLLVPFDVVIPENEQNANLIAELTEELPGIFNWSMEGLRRLKQRGKFIEPRISVSAKKEYQCQMNPARTFLLDNYGSDTDSKISVDTLYQEYRKYCLENGNTPTSNVNFGKEVSRTFKESYKSRISQNGNRISYYIGIVKGPDNSKPQYSGLDDIDPGCINPSATDKKVFDWS